MKTKFMCVRDQVGVSAAQWTIDVYFEKQFYFCSFSFVYSSIANQISDFYFKMQFPFLPECFESKTKIMFKT